MMTGAETHGGLDDDVIDGNAVWGAAPDAGVREFRRRGRPTAERR